MDARAQRGLEIANRSKLTQQNGLWLVPSEHTNQQYTVDLASDKPRCTCRDHEFRRATCKHIHAVLIVVERTKTVTTTTTVEEGKPPVTQTVETETVKVRRTYRQEWASYNRAQTHEKSEFQALLYALCAGVEMPVNRFGRPRLPIADMLFSVVFKTYTTLSGRRYASDLKEAHRRGFLSECPHYNSISRYLESEALTPYLKQLITDSSLPLKSVETDFAVDSSGFATAHFLRWFDAKYGREMREQDWVKVHLMCGVRTNVVTSVEISKAYASDYNYYKPLVDKTAQSGFNMKEVSADKAYLGAGNFAATLKHGAIPYIPFKVNSQPNGNGALWARIYHFYNFQRDEFLQHYHKRSNVETTFSMIKAKFGERLRSKTPTAQVNEALCKVLAHNICCLIQSVYELGIQATFESDFAVAS
ncbi:MAG TPA: transposase [Pyrinomonadaceae bacterium]|nr:transposase [Pyrinomonadaceae bacterium]